MQMIANNAEEETAASPPRPQPHGGPVLASQERSHDRPSDEWDQRFADLAARQARFMFRVAHSLLRSVPDAEDAVQESLLKLYRTDGWRAMDDEKAFLARTVWRVGLDLIARRTRSTEPLDANPGRDFPASGESAEQSLVGHGERELLRRLIDMLPEDLRQPLVLCAIEEMTSREVAVAMGIPEGTVRTRTLRARTELKRRFEAMKNTNPNLTSKRNGENR